MKRFLNGLLPAVIIALTSWTFYASGQGTNSPGSRVTVQNPSSNPVIVTCTNCGAASVTGPFNVTVTNTAGSPAIVSSPNGFGGTTTGALQVTITNTVPVPVSEVNSSPILAAIQSSIPTGSNIIGQVTILNAPAQQVTVTNSITATATGPFNVTITNTAASPAIVSSPNGFGGTTSGALQVTVTNTIPAHQVTVTNTTNVSVTNALPVHFVTVTNDLTDPVAVSVLNAIQATITNTTLPAQSVTVTNTNPNGLTSSANSSPVVIASDQAAITIANGISKAIAVSVMNGINSTIPVSVLNTIPVHFVTVTNDPTDPVSVSVLNITSVTCQNCQLSTTGGWTTLLVDGLTNARTVKSTAGQLGNIYCFNPNNNVAYLQVFNTTSGGVTLGTTAPAQSYGIGVQTSANNVLSRQAPGNIGDQYLTAIAVASTTTVRGLTTTSINCNVSYN